MDFLEELYHHGIKGQKWGVRRYQNPDGSLTADGKLRYNKSTKSNLEDHGWMADDDEVGYYKKINRNFERNGIATFFTTDGAYDDRQKQTVLDKESSYTKRSKEIRELVYDDIIKQLRSSNFGKSVLSEVPDSTLKDYMYVSMIRINPDKDYSDRVFVDLTSLLGEGGEYTSLFSLKTSNIARSQIYSDDLDLE